MRFTQRFLWRALVLCVAVYACVVTSSVAAAAQDDKRPTPPRPGGKARIGKIVKIKIVGQLNVGAGQKAKYKVVATDANGQEEENPAGYSIKKKSGPGQFVNDTYVAPVTLQQEATVVLEASAGGVSTTLTIHAKP